jgi:hypothetical protein
MKARDAASDFFDHTNALMAENSAIGHGRKIAFQDVKIGSADG